MNKTEKKFNANFGGNMLTVDAETLAAMLNCGRVTARKIGEDSGARIQIGRRVLYLVSRVESYLDMLSGE